MKSITFRISCIVFTSLLTCSLLAQQPSWKSFNESKISVGTKQKRQIVPNVYRTQAVDFSLLTNYLMNEVNGSVPSSFSVPKPNGASENFNIKESNVFSDGLSAKYPSIRTYKGTSESGAKIHMGISPDGFHAMILDRNGSYFIDKYSSDTKNLYVSYYRKDYSVQQPFECLVEDKENEVQTYESSLNSSAGDCMLRKYRLALACTGEYATFHGGTVTSVLEEFAVAMTRVNGIYERDNGITMELIENTDDVIFFDATTDPYTNNNGGTMLNQNQNTLDDIIGTANYDIGHVFSTGGGGIAQLNSPCGGGKARGVTGLGSPINDPFYVDYVSHEMGHQFGGNHTQNNSCNRNNATAMEPGSANTIMGYAGICAPNTANNSDDHFHAISIQEIANFIVNGNGANCAEFISNENNAPVLTVDQEMYNVPIGTPFVLTAIGEDADNDPMTFCWEQMDNEVADMPPSNTNTGGPAFLSIPPKTEPYRYFPNISAVVANQIPTWEVVPFVERSMNFRCTVRDNHMSLGCTDEVNVNLEFIGDAGPFLVMNPNTNVIWNTGDTETVTWDVSGTDQAPISCNLVDIKLSVDGGFTYPITIESGVENDGSHEITVPAYNTDLARVMVMCHDNVFFDISDENFTIKSPFSFQFDHQTTIFCGPEMDDVLIETQAFDNFDEDLTFEVLNVPDGMTVIFSENPVSPPNSTNMNVENENALPGVYPITVIANTSVVNLEQIFEVTVLPNQLDQAIGIFPPDSLQGVGPSIPLEWQGDMFTETYTILLSTSPSFASNVQTIEVTDGTLESVFENLVESTVYYWKVKSDNFCSMADDSPVYAFQTAVSNCHLFEGTDLQIEIPANDVSTISHSIEVSGITSYDYMKAFVDVDHTWLGDIKISIISPAGTEAILVDQIGVPASQFGCDSDDFVLDFFDNSLNTADDLENSCNVFESNYQAVDLFSVFNGENVNGSWTIEISDFFDQDGGELDAWSLEFCSDGAVSDGELTKNSLIVENSGVKSIAQFHLSIDNSDDELSEFTFLSLPQHGIMEIDVVGMGEFIPASIGTTFSESMINNGRLRYAHGGENNDSDNFFFDAVDENKAWNHNEEFTIIINDGTLTGLASIANSISCFGGHDGSIVVDAIGGQEPYEFSLDGDIFQSSPIFDNLEAGVFEIIVKDALGVTFTVNPVELMQPSIIQVNATLDFYNIIVNPAGGNAGYLFSLDGENYQESNVFVNPGNGDYLVYVQDANGCVESMLLTIGIESLNLVTTITNEIECNGENTGSFEISGTGGFEPFEYSLDGTIFNDITSYSDLPAGSYTIFIKDAGGLIISEELIISEPEEIVLTGTFANNMLLLDGTGGTGGLTYSLDGENFSDQVSYTNYSNMTFNAYVQDEKGCEIEIELEPLQTILDVEEIDCYAANNGSLELTTTGGSNAGYEFSLDQTIWQSEPVFENLTPSNYIVYVRDDANNSISTSEITLIEPDEITGEASFDGTTVTVTANGGTGLIVYSFDGGSTFKDINIYEWQGEAQLLIIIKDENGCELELLYTVTNVEESFADLGVLIYPNPVRNLIQIKIADLSIHSGMTFEFINSIGQTVLESKIIHSGISTINIEHLPAGLYHIRTSLDGKLYSKKLVVVE